MHEYSNQYHRIFNIFRSTAGFATAIPTLSPASVKSSCTLLKPSVRISNVPLGAIALVRNRSRPCVNSREVDSIRAGEETRLVAPSIY